MAPTILTSWSIRGQALRSCYPPDAPGWQFYHPTSRRVFPSQDVTFDESVPFYRLFPYRSAPPPPPPLFLAPGPPPVDPLPPQGPAPSGAARGAASGGVEPGGAEPGGTESEGAGSEGAEPGGSEPGGVEPKGVEPGGAESRGVASSGGPTAAGATGAGGAGVTVGASGTRGTAAAGPGGACTRGTGAAGTGGVGGAGARDPTEPGAAGAGGTGVGAGGAGAGGTDAGGAGAGGARAEGPGAGGAGAGAFDPGAGGAGAGGTGCTCAGGTVRPRPYFVPLLRQPASRPVSPVCTARRVPHLRPPPVPGTHAMALRPYSIPLCIPLPPPPESSFPSIPDPGSNLVRAASPTVSRLLATVVSDPSFESTVASALVAELLYFAAACRLDYTTALVTKSGSPCPPSAGGECALGTNVLEDRQEDFECLAAAVPRFASMPLAPEGDPDAPDIPTPRSYAEAFTVPPSGPNIVDGMWIFRVKRTPGSPPAFKARYVARGFSQRQGVDYFQTFSPTPKMTTLRMLLHVAAQRDYELHSLDFSTTFLQGNLHEEIWLRRPPGFTRSFPASNQWSLRRPIYGLCQAPREWHDTLRTTLAALGFAPSTADSSLFLRTDTSLPPFYVLVYVLQRLGFQLSSPQPTPLSTSHLLSAPPSDESVEPSGSYPELVGCLMYLMTTSGMGLVLGGRGPVVLTGHADASWVDDSATHRSSQGYTFSLGSGSVSWQSTRSSSVLSSSCEAVIYAGAMAAQELRWLTYLLTDLGEQPRSPPQRGQLHLAYVATRTNTADTFTKAFPPGDHQRFSTVLGLLALLFLTGLVTTCSPPLCLWGEQHAAAPTLLFTHRALASPPLPFPALLFPPLPSLFPPSPSLPFPPLLQSPSRRLPVPVPSSPRSDHRTCCPTAVVSPPRVLPSRCCFPTACAALPLLIPCLASSALPHRFLPFAFFPVTPTTAILSSFPLVNLLASSSLFPRPTPTSSHSNPSPSVSSLRTQADTPQRPFSHCSLTLPSPPNTLPSRLSPPTASLLRMANHAVLATLSHSTPSIVPRCYPSSCPLPPSVCPPPSHQVEYAMEAVKQGSGAVGLCSGACQHHSLTSLLRSLAPLTPLPSPPSHQVEYAMEAVKQGSGAVGLCSGACQHHSLTSLLRSLAPLTPLPSPPSHQVEYAMEAVKQGSAAVGLRSTTHAVLATLKRAASPLASYQRKIFRVDDHMGIAIAGLNADGRVLCRFMRSECLSHKPFYCQASVPISVVKPLLSPLNYLCPRLAPPFSPSRFLPLNSLSPCPHLPCHPLPSPHLPSPPRFVFESPLPVGRLVSMVADKSQVCTQRSWRRPYGVGLLVAGFDQTGPHIFQTCPSGNFWEFHAMAIGARSQAAKTYLERKYESFGACSLDELVRHALLAVKESLQEGELSGANCSVSIVGEGQAFSILTDAQVQEHIDRMENEEGGQGGAAKEEVEVVEEVEVEDVEEEKAGEGEGEEGGTGEGSEGPAPMEA
ncbi:unnamed protein product [Closterium sp. NIES-53]